ncbi:MAG: hypothetical protein HRT45_12805 [Bdellovibrionales bacterium]|nr:hypothetical protein [Bdellovibrionales bacterium]
MELQYLDFIFPFFVLAYGALLTFVLHVPALERLAETRLPQHVNQQLQAHRILAVICLIVGGLWSLQNIWSQSNPLF